MLGRAGRFSRYQFLGLVERNTEVGTKSPAAALVVALTLLSESDPIVKEPLDLEIRFRSIQIVLY